MRLTVSTTPSRIAPKSLWWTTASSSLPSFRRYVLSYFALYQAFAHKNQTHGCSKVKPTTSYGGVNNPGLMQSHKGTEYNAKHYNQSIYDMVQDGTQGTRDGDGLVQNLIYYGNAYSAARGYNSGIQPLSGNLSEATGATACYVSDLANRLTGWVYAETKCHEDAAE